MALDVDVPDPPDLTTGLTDDYEANASRRFDLQRYFEEENAWGEAFEEWAAVTNLTEAEYAIVDDLDLITGFDFFWNPDAAHVEYDTPSLRSHPSALDRYPELDSAAKIVTIDDALEELGEIVADVLTEYYVEWETEDVFAERYDADEKSG